MSDPVVLTIIFICVAILIAGLRGDRP